MGIEGGDLRDKAEGDRDLVGDGTRSREIRRDSWFALSPIRTKREEDLVRDLSER